MDKVRRRKFVWDGGKYEAIVIQTGRDRGRVRVEDKLSKQILEGWFVDGELKPSSVCQVGFLRAVEEAAKPLLPEIERVRVTYRQEREERKASLAKALQERDEARSAHDQATVELVKFRAELSKAQTERDDFRKSFVDEVKRTDKLSREKYDLRNHLKRVVVEVLRAGETATEAYLELHEADDAGPALKRLLEIRNAAKGLLTEDLQKVLVESGGLGSETWGALGMAAWTILGCYAMLKPKKEGA